MASFAPFYKSNKCIIVTTGNRLVIHDFDQPNSSGTEKRIDERFQVIKVIMSRDDRRILALGKPNQYGEFCLIELVIEGDYSNVDVSVIKRFDVQYLDYSLEKVQIRWLEPEYDTGTQNTTTQSSRVLIAVLARSHEKAVFEVDVQS